MRWKPHVTVATVVEHQGDFLMVEERSGDALVYNQPAGHWERGETLLEAALRETLEETAWHVRLTALVGVYQWDLPGSALSFVRLCFAGERLRQAPGRGLDEGIERVLWLPYARLVAEAARMRSPMVLRCIDDYRAGRRFPLDLIASL